MNPTTNHTTGLFHYNFILCTVCQHIVSIYMRLSCGIKPFTYLFTDSYGQLMSEANRCLHF